MRTFQEAKAFALREHENPTREWLNDCQLFSRQCVGAGPFGGSARLAFNGIDPRRRHTSNPPPGSIAYYGSANRGNGHAVFVVEGGFVWSNDILRKGKIDRVRWDVFPDAWNQPFRGWIETCPSGALPIRRRQDARPTYRQNKQVYRSKMKFRQKDSDSVWNLQLALMSRGFTIGAGPTGFFGAQTLAATAALQGAQGWKGRKAAGIPGPRTARLLGLVWVED